MSWELCRCGRPLVVRSGDIEATCGECRSKPDWCNCGKLSGAETLDRTHGVLSRYVVFPSPEAADAVTLWAATSHVQRELEFAPRLVIKSPVKRCGKSRLLDVIAALVRAPILTSDISAAALVRSINPADPPVLMLDEADAIFGKALKGDEKAEHLRGILNAGFGRDRPYRRWDVTARATELCPTFAMAALAGIGSLPDTIEDRAIIISLRRKTAAEPVAKYRIRRDKKEVQSVGKLLGEWAATIAEKAGQADPEMPRGLDDRAEDLWEGLLAVADLAGGEWPRRARDAAEKLSADGRAADASLSERLLTDLRDVFGGAEAMHGETILAALHKIPEAPWADYYGRPLAARDLAKLVRPWGVSSTNVNIGGVIKKGYRREHLQDPWNRYLSPAKGGSATSATSVTSQVSAVPEVAGSGRETLPATSDPALTRQVAEVAEVADIPDVRDRDQSEDVEVAQVAEVAEPPGAEPLCAVCGLPMNAKLAAAGHTTHPCCEPPESQDVPVLGDPDELPLDDDGPPF